MRAGSEGDKAELQAALVEGGLVASKAGGTEAVMAVWMAEGRGHRQKALATTSLAADWQMQCPRSDDTTLCLLVL